MKLLCASIQRFMVDGKRKPTARLLPWYNQSQPPSDTISLLKNRWVMLSYQGREAYTQWEDVGPMKSDNFSYVFGSKRPNYAKTGIDLSPAVASSHGFEGHGKVTWRFVDERAVPNGPWKKIVIHRQVSWQ
ncbi:hypothetical protein TM7_0340 [candidate division TM7 genomosp. GTL1]|nr:hypothetical protein TM7_0340 [candidate division TM7 genomosp. GTL1]